MNSPKTNWNLEFSTPNTVSPPLVSNLFCEKKFSAERIFAEHRNSFCFSPQRNAVSAKVLNPVRVSVVEPSVLLVTIRGSQPIVVQRELGEFSDSEALDQSPAASISERCR